MPHKLKITDKDVLEKKSKNEKRDAECVEFVRQATNAPPAILWQQGMGFADAKLGEILRRTAIAAFDERGKYPTDELGKHAAICRYQTNDASVVLDQWTKKGEVRQRMIQFKKPKVTSRSDNGSTFAPSSDLKRLTE